LDFQKNVRNEFDGLRTDKAFEIFFKSDVNKNKKNKKNDMSVVIKNLFRVHRSGHSETSKFLWLSDVPHWLIFQLIADELALLRQNC